MTALIDTAVDHDWQPNPGTGYWACVCGAWTNRPPDETPPEPCPSDFPRWGAHPQPEAGAE